MYVKHAIGVIIPPPPDSPTLNQTLASIPKYVDRIYLMENLNTAVQSFPNIFHIEVNGIDPDVALSVAFKQALTDGMDVVCIIGSTDNLPSRSLDNILNPVIGNRTKYARIECISSDDQQEPRGEGEKPFRFLVSSTIAHPQFSYQSLLNGVTAIAASSAGHLAELLSHRGKRILVAIPSHNEELSIGSVIIKARRFVDEVLVVDDGSTDDSSRIASDAGATLINHNERQGIQKTIAAAISYARDHDYDILVFLDGSGRYNSDLIPALIEPLITESADVVIGSRYYTKRTAIPLLSRIEDADALRCEFVSTDPTSLFRALGKKAMMQILDSKMQGDPMAAMLLTFATSGTIIKDISIDAFAETSNDEIPLYKKYKIAVVVPAYNEESLISETLASIPDFVFRVYAVNDCSKDRTGEIIDHYAQHDHTIVPIHHPQNKGVGASIASGYKAALADGIDIVAVMAGDNQMNPIYLPHLLDPIIDRKCDYVVGNRLINPEYRKGMSRWRFFGNAILTMLTKIASGYWQLVDPQNGFTAISNRALQRLDLDHLYPRYGYCNDLLVKLNICGFRMKNVPHPARYGSEKSRIRYSTYILRVSRLLWHDFLERLKMKYIILSFHPLVFFYLAGMILAPLGILGGIITLIEKFIMGFPVLFVHGILSLLVFIIGMMLLFFGMLFDMQQEKTESEW